MRLVGFVVALAVTLVACGGKAQPHSQDDGDDDGPFVNRAGFQPTAFSAKVTGEGRPVIFIPGLACPGSVWDDTVERLGNGVQAHVLTLSGFAGSDPIKPPLVAKTRKELVRYIRSNHLKDPIIVGHSLGGFIAYWLAATAPDVVGAIVVVDAGPRYFANNEEARLLRNTWAQAGDDELPVALRNLFSQMVRDPRHVAPYIEQIAKSDRQTIGDTIYELVKTDITDKVPSITAPVLLVLADGGLQGRYRKQATGIDDLEVIVVPKTGHFVMLDDPAGFTRALSAFIAKHD
ncbi:MAG TPA: alpha/beta hydrolase [Kofleriaceae bacterium]